MQFQSVTMRVISAPLKTPFVTHLETVVERSAIILQVRDIDGCCGYGEADPFSSPWYSAETTQTCVEILKTCLIPLLLQRTIDQLSDLEPLFAAIRGHHMAKSGLIQAVWDYEARRKKVPLHQLSGGSRKKVDAGAVIASSDPSEALEQIAQFSEMGYKRYKIKISKATDHRLLRTIRQAYPNLPLMADANSSYTLADSDHLQSFDRYHLLMIEQPLACNDLVDHARLQTYLQTPICLDESLQSRALVQAALQLGSCRVATIKMAALGGWGEALRVAQLCRSYHVPVWCGGMIEFGIAKAHNLALAARSEFTLPGDLAASSRYWEEDIIQPEIQVVNGSVHVPDKDGIGFSINEQRLTQLTEQSWVFTK
ncbi:MAG: o-succinylbenzoate synthase [Sporolactobacillus sp.]